MPELDPSSGLEIFGPIYEESSAVFSGEVVDEDGELVTSLDTLKVTIFDKKTLNIINGRDQQSILNENGGTFSAGDLSFVLSRLDTVVYDQTREYEDHIVRFDFTYNEGSRTGVTPFILRIKNLKRR